MSDTLQSQPAQPERTEAAPQESAAADLAGPPGTRGGDRLWRLAVLVLGCAILAQGIHAMLYGWVASGDDGYWALMARSVFSTHPPMVGSSSSGGLESSVPYYHLGPLGFYLLAPFVWLFGGQGLALGVSVVNTTSVVVAAVAVRRSVGMSAGWLALVAGALLQLTMGSEVLVDPWNPNLAVLPLWCSFCVAWAVVHGGRNWAAAGIFAASIALQTHLSFAPFAAITAVVIVWAAAYGPGEPGRDDHAVPERKSWAYWAPVLWALGTGVVLNLIPVVQQFFGPGPPNISTALSGSATQDSVMGLARASQSVFYFFLPGRLLPGDWRRDPIPPGALAGWTVIIPAVVVIGAMVLLTVSSWRSQRYRQATTLGFGALLVIVAVIVASRTSTVVLDRPFVRMSLFRWAWPLALFVGVSLVHAAWRQSGPLGARLESRRNWLHGAAVLFVFTLVVANMPPRDEGSGARPVQREAINAVLKDAGPLIAQRGRPLIQVGWDTSAVATPALMDWLDQRGYDFGLDDETALRQAGSRFRRNGSETSTVAIRFGEAAVDSPNERFERLARWTPLPRTDLDWFMRERELVEKRLGDLAQRVETDPELRAQALPSDVDRPDLREHWFRQLCKGSGSLSVRLSYMRRHVIADGERERLCRFAQLLTEQALAVDVGPAPG